MEAVASENEEPPLAFRADVNAPLITAVEI